jgi:hypothetical protein
MIERSVDVSADRELPRAVRTLERALLNNVIAVTTVGSPRHFRSGSNAAVPGRPPVFAANVPCRHADNGGKTRNGILRTLSR